MTGEGCSNFGCEARLYWFSSSWNSSQYSLQRLLFAGNFNIIKQGINGVILNSADILDQWEGSGSVSITTPRGPYPQKKAEIDTR